MLETEKVKTDVARVENDIVYSKAIKAGKRIYYLDVKKSRNDDLFVAITESKKKVFGTEDNLQVSFEKHKIFLYKEDFDKFLEGIEDVINFVKKERPMQNDVSDVENFMAENDADADADAEVEAEIEVSKKSFFSKFKL
jgi:hypothetical protein